MSRYELLLFLHIAAAIVWLGAALTIQLLGFRAERARDPAAVQHISASAEWLATRVFIPSSLSVLVLGVLLVLDGPWSFDHLWIILGLVGYAPSFGVGILYFKPVGARIHALGEQHGPQHAEVARRARRIDVVSRIELVILFLVVADMSLKPTADDVGTLIVGAVIIAAAVALGARALRPAADRDLPAEPASG